MLTPRSDNTRINDEVRQYIEAEGHTLRVGPVGEMSALQSGNPYFWNFTAVSPVYCDGLRGYAGSIA